MNKLLTALCVTFFSISLTAQSTWVQLAAGGEFTVGLSNKGSIYTWGYNGSGQLGNGGSGDSNVNTPTKISDTLQFIQVDAGNYHALAIGSDSTLWAWGYNGYKQVDPNASSDIVPVPSVVDSSNKWVGIYAGFNISFAVDTLGDYYVWGSNVKGEAGVNSEALRIDKLTKIEGSNKFKEITCGKNYTLALDFQGNIWGWGDNEYNTLTSRHGEMEIVPVLIDSSDIYTAIASSYNSSHAVNADGKLFSWGSNKYKESGIKDAPEIIDTISSVGKESNMEFYFTDVVCGGTQCFATEGADNYIFTWGTNNIWRFSTGGYESDTVVLMDSNSTDYEIPIPSKGLDDGLSVFGGHILFFLKEAGRESYCGAGPNYVGQIGSSKDREKFEEINCSFGAITGAQDVLYDVADIRVYPNPAQHELFIDGLGEIIKDIKIINLQGQVLLHKEINSEYNQISINHLQPGIYVVHSILMDGSQGVTKIIVN